MCTCTAANATCALGNSCCALLLTCHAVTCPGAPTSISISNATWSAGCVANGAAALVGAQCAAICIGDGSSPTATCQRNGNAATASWQLTSAGSCTNTYKSGATCSNINPSVTPASAFICGNSFGLKGSPASIPINGMTTGQAKAACCDVLYGSTATCGANVTCQAPLATKPGFNATPVNGLVVGGQAAQNLCCSTVRELCIACRLPKCVDVRLLLMVLDVACSSSTARCIIQCKKDNIMMRHVHGSLNMFHATAMILSSHIFCAFWQTPNSGVQ